jgi:hypothetical protein
MNELHMVTGISKVLHEVITGLDVSNRHVRSGGSERFCGVATEARGSTGDEDRSAFEGAVVHW